MRCLRREKCEICTVVDMAIGRSSSMPTSWLPFVDVAIVACSGLKNPPPPPPRFAGSHACCLSLPIWVSSACCKEIDREALARTRHVVALCLIKTKPVSVNRNRILQVSTVCPLPSGACAPFLPSTICSAIGGRCYRAMRSSRFRITQVISMQCPYYGVCQCSLVSLASAV